MGIGVGAVANQLVCLPFAFLDALIRVPLKTIPKTLLARLPFLRKLTDYIFSFSILQALALFFAFLINVTSHLSLNAVKISLSHSTEAPGLQFSLFRGFCTFYAAYSILRCLFWFSEIQYLMLLESFNNFPQTIKAIQEEKRPAPEICAVLLVPTLTLGFALAFHSNEYLCGFSPFAYVFIAKEWKRSVGFLGRATLFCFTQWLQIFFFIFPARSVKKVLPKYCKRAIGLFLSASSLFLLVCTATYSRRLMFGGEMNELKVGNNSLGLWVLFFWMLWCLILVLTMSLDVQDAPRDLTVSMKAKMMRFLSRLKFTFFSFLGFVFVCGVIHPAVGVIEAFEEIIALSIIVPMLYGCFYATARIARKLRFGAKKLKAEVGFVVVSGPVSVALAYFVIEQSSFGARNYKKNLGTLFFLSVHLFKKIVQFFVSDVEKGEKSEVKSKFENLRRIPEEQKKRLGVKTRESFSIKAVSRIKRARTVVQGTIKDFKTERPLFTGFVRACLAVLFVFGLFLLLLGLAARLQDRFQAFPTLITSKDDGETLKIRHVKAVHLNLHRTEEQPEFTETPNYAVCGKRWNGLSILDFALLSEAAYFPDSDELKRVIDGFFRGTEISWDLVHENNNEGAAQFIEIYSKSLDLSVVSIRGTDVGRLSDIVEDIRLFTEPVVLTILSIVVPTIRFWPHGTSALIIGFFNGILETIFNLETNSYYYDPILKHIRGIEHKVVITGHSLGGGLAKIVGALTGKATVAFSPPGITLSRRKFVSKDGSGSVKLEKTYDSSISVVAMHDPVSMVDQHGGLVQYILCSTSKLALKNSCHLLESTICELLRACGDSRARFKSCSYSFNVIPEIKKVLEPLLKSGLAESKAGLIFFEYARQFIILFVLGLFLLMSIYTM